MKAVVIGAGIGGIASAIRLSKMGFEVDVFEANSYPGGKLSEIWVGDYRYDAGPSLFTLPEQVEELFLLCEEERELHFQYDAIDPVMRYFWEDGTMLNAYADRDKLCEEIETKLGEPKAHIQQFLDLSQRKYELTSDIFLKSSLHKMSTFFNKKALRAILELPKLELFKTMHAANEAQFKNPKLVQLFDRYATYNGSDPYQAPATLNVIPHLEFNMGAYIPRNGLYDITKSLVRLAEKMGAKFHYNQKIDKIWVENTEAKGIEIGGKKQTYDLVMSNMDVFNAYKVLLPEQKQPEMILKQPKSSSALIFYWGMDCEFPELDLHNIFFSRNYKAEFEHIFKKRTLYQDPTVYIFISSKHCPKDAPKGGENWFVMINTPANDGSQDWDRLIAQAKQQIIDKLERMLLKYVGKHIVAEEILDPRTIESKTSSSGGSLYGSSSNNRYAAFLRHANFSNQIKNLYFCGGSVHPGGGIPLSLLSAKIACEIIQER
ncbi:MAG: phytoene desaturase [Bernardetiaceae bacterium]|nr:phytoene desaturase [Bernardetiaceae bacterium]